MYEFINHPADVAIKATGKDLPELFCSALDGMNEILKPGLCAGAAGTASEFRLEITAADPTILLIDFLSRVLTKTHEQRAIFCRAEFERLINTQLLANLGGAPVTEFAKDLKAVTYHRAEILKNEKGEWETIVVFDI